MAQQKQYIMFECDIWRKNNLSYYLILSLLVSGCFPDQYPVKYYPVKQYLAQSQ